MYILGIFLYDSRFLEDFLEVLLQEEVEEVFISEAQELKEVLAFKFPLFKELQITMGGKRKEPKLILALVREEDKIKQMVKLWREDLQLDKEEIATIFSIPVKLWQLAPHMY